MPLEVYAGLSGPMIEMLLEHSEKPIVKVSVHSRQVNQTRDALLHRQYLEAVNKVGLPKATIITPLGHSFLIKALKHMDWYLSRWHDCQMEKLAARDVEHLGVAAAAPDLYIHAHVNDQDKIDIAIVACGQGGALAHHESTTLPEEREVA